MRMLSILPFCGILVAAAALAEHSGSRIERTVPLTMFVLALAVYASGLFGSLLPGLILCYALIACSAAFLAVRIRQKRFDPSRILTPGLVFLLAVYAFGLFVHRQETLIGWDESSHWILTLRNSFALDRFGAVAASSADYKTYPPIAAMFHYFFTKTAVVYANTTVRMSVTVLTAGLLAPLLAVFDCKTARSRLWALFAGVILFALPFAYFKNAFFGTQVDLLQGLVTACVLVLYFCSDRKRLGLLTAAAGVAFLTLTKDSGLILALIAAGVIAVDRLFFAVPRDPVTGRRRIRVRDALIALGLIALPLLAKLTWTGYLYLNGIAEEASDQLDFWMIDYVKAILTGRFREDYAHSYRVEGFLQFWRSVLYDANFHENTRFWLFGVTVPYSVKLAVSALLMALAARLSGEKGRMRAAFSLLFVGNLVWLGGISVLYLCRFSDFENAVLSSVSRYLGTGLIAMDVLSASLLLRALAASPAPEGKRVCARRIAAAAVSAALVLPSLGAMFSQEAYADYKGRPLLNFTVTELDRAYDAYTAAYARIAPYVTGDDDVLIIAPPREHDTLWYKHTLPPLSKVKVMAAEDVTIGWLHAHTKLYLFPDTDAARAASQLGGLPLAAGALYEIAEQDGAYALLRVF